MSKLPDLERMISRIHAGAAKLSEFISVLEAFETCLVYLCVFYLTASP